MTTELLESKWNERQEYILPIAKYSSQSQTAKSFLQHIAPSSLTDHQVLYGIELIQEELNNPATGILSPWSEEIQAKLENFI